MRWRPGANVVNNARDIGVTRKAEVGVQRLERAHGAELGHPGIVHHAKVVGGTIRLEGRNQLLEELVVGKLDDFDIDAGLRLVDWRYFFERAVFRALDSRNGQL